MMSVSAAVPNIALDRVKTSVVGAARTSHHPPSQHFRLPGIRLPSVRLLAAAALGLCAAAGQTSAAGPQATFLGRVNTATHGVMPSPWNEVQIGDEWSVTICFDPSTPNVCDAVGVGCYPAITQVYLRAGSAAESAEGNPIGSITVTDFVSGTHDSYSISFMLPSGVQFTMDLVDTTGQALDSERLPLCHEIPNILRWDVRRMLIDNPAPLGGSRGGPVTRIICERFIQCGPCPACAADYNEDGGIEGADVQAFFYDWERGFACADVNRDGGVDGSDVGRFFQYWEAGTCCFGAPDYNGDRLVTCADVCEFLTGFRAGESCADVNADGAVDVRDVDFFFDAYRHAGGPHCPQSADFDGDGHVDCRDLCRFQRAFAFGDPAADVNCDGVVDAQDIADFQLSYTQQGGTRCPDGGDFNLDGRVNCSDVCAFQAAISVGDVRTDYNCDGAIDHEDYVLFFAAYIHEGGSDCPHTGDFNGDNRVNCADVCAFQAAVRAGDPRADYNCDGVIDSQDTTLFIAAYTHEGGRPCPTGADFNLDGRINCLDIRAFESEFALGNPTADLNCDGQRNDRDRVIFYTSFLDWTRNGVLNCLDRCAFYRALGMSDPQTDLDCDGVVTHSDALVFNQLFDAYYHGPLCLPCP